MGIIYAILGSPDATDTGVME